jgi:hypothetical protein
MGRNQPGVAIPVALDAQRCVKLGEMADAMQGLLEANVGRWRAR